jgi:hypothetical protein
MNPAEITSYWLFLVSSAQPMSGTKSLFKRVNMRIFLSAPPERRNGVQPPAIGSDPSKSDAFGETAKVV